MKGKQLLVLLSAAALLASCNTQPTTSHNGGTDSTTSTGGDNTDILTTGPTTTIHGLEDFVNNIKSNHNYTLKVRSYIEDDPTDVYEDTFKMINNQAYFNKYYEGYAGIIKQADQGYITYIQSATGQIMPQGFYSTNPNSGVSDIFEITAENLFLGDYIYDSTNNEYFTTDRNSIAVGCNFSGFANSTNMVAPEKLTATFNATDETLTINCEYTIWYINEETGEEMHPQGHCTITIGDLGRTTDKTVENYIANPTKTYTAQTNWTADDKSLLDSCFNKNYISYLPNASYSFTMTQELRYDGPYLLLSDYACGDQSAAWGQKLVEVDGFTKVSDTKYTLVVKSEALQQTTTYTIQTKFTSPDTEYGLNTIGTYYPNGIFQAELRVRTVANAVDSVSSFNSYITSKGINKYIPLLPWGSEVTKISKFEDRTDTMAQTYGDNYIFYTSTTYMNVYVADYNTAKNTVNKYIELLKEYGFTSVETGSGVTNVSVPQTEDVDYPSYVSFSDFGVLTAANYTGYFQMRFCLYKGLAEHTDTPVTTAHKVSISTSVANGTLKINGSSNPIDAEEGDQVTISVTADENYEIDGAPYCEEDPTMVFTKSPFGNSYSFTMPNHDVTLNCKFKSTGTVVEPETSKLTSITLSGQKITYELNDTFTFNGTVTAHYENGSTKVVTPTSVSTPDMSIIGEKSVTVTYTENDVTVSANYTITVTEPAAGLSFSGVYQWSNKYTNASLVFTFNEDGTGNYTYNKSASEIYSLDFSYTYDGTNIVINKTVSTTDNYGSYYLFSGDATSNATITLAENSLTIQLYNADGDAYSSPKTFTKQ